MSAHYVVYFDATRRRYTVRSRHRGRDVKRVVPRDLFTAAELPHDEPTKRGERIAQRWAAENTQKREAEMSLKDLFALYAERNPEAVSASTLTRNGQYAAHLVRLLEMKPSQIDIDAAVDYRNTRAGEGARNRTILGELTYLKQVLTYGFESKRVTGMQVVSLLRLPNIKKQDSTGIALTTEEVRLILATPVDRNAEQFRRLIVFGVLTGHRLTPMLNFRREWMDNGWQNVPAEFMKGGVAYRAPIAATATRMAGGYGEGLAFPNRNGWPIRWPFDTVETVVRLNEGKVREFSAHDLRRTFATWLYDIGVDKLTRGRLLNHAAFAEDVTDSYTKESERKLVDAVALLESEIGAKLVPVPDPVSGTDVPALEGNKYPTRRERGDSRRLRRSAKSLK